MLEDEQHSENADKVEKQKLRRKYKICTIVFMVIAVILIALAFCTPFAIEAVMVKNTKKNA